MSVQALLRQCPRGPLTGVSAVHEGHAAVAVVAMAELQVVSAAHLHLLMPSPTAQIPRRPRNEYLPASPFDWKISGET